MKVGAFFGYKCQRCNSRVHAGVSIGTGAPLCSGCLVPMVPDDKGQASAGNVYCSQCDIWFGLVLSDKCPKCGGPFSKLPD